jgi:hypothetical protein
MFPTPVKPALTVNLVGTDTDILAQGICQDETLFKHVHFRSLTEAYTYLHNQYKKSYRVVLNIHPSAKRFQ